MDDNSREHSIDISNPSNPEEEFSDKKSIRDSLILQPNNTKKSLFGTIKSWYQPTYVKALDAPTDEKPKLRYCNGRLTKKKFIFLHLLIISLLLTIIFIPITYYLIIPAVIRYKVQHVDLNDVTIDHMDVTEWKSDGLRFSWKATLPKQLAIPLKTKLAALNLTIHDTKLNNLLVVGIPEMEVNLGEPVDLNFEGDVTFTETTGLKDFLGQVSQPDGIKDTSIFADTQITVNMWGITWYKDLSIRRTIPIPKLDGNLLDLWNTMPKSLISKDMQNVTLNQPPPSSTINIGGVNETGVNKPLVIDGVEYWQILPGFPPINLQSFDTVLTNDGPILSLKALMINPTVVSIPLPDTSIGLQLEGSYLATANVKGFNLTRGLNHLDLNLQLIFDPSRIVAPNQLSNSISEAAGKLLGADQSNDELRFNVIGPVKVKDVDFVGNVTELLSLTLPINEIISNTNVKLLKNLLNVSGVQSLLHAVHFDVNIQQDRIVIPIDVTLPSFLPLPPSFVFNYSTSLGIFKGDQNVLTVGLGGISMTNNQTLNIKTTTTIFPNNTFEAADALAAIINPSLAGNISSADIKNFAVFNETGGTFPWVNQLFGSLSLNIPIPGFNTTAIVNMLTQNGTSIPVETLGMSLTQRVDVAGFNVNGTVAIKYPPFLPIVTIGAGYLETTIYTDDVLLATTKLPSGLRYTAGENSTNIVASAILNKDDRLKSIISDLVMSVLATEDNIKMPIIGISGVKLGMNEAQSFVTFSKVLVPINLDTLRPAMKTAVTTTSKTLQQQVGLLSLTGVDFAILTSNSLSINIQSILNNPTNIIASIGSVSFTTTLFYGDLANITISPIQLALGKSPFNLQMRIDVVDGKNGMSDNILQLFNDLTSTGGDFRSVIGIKNLIISPPPLAQGGNVNTTLATIDQFSKAQITVPSSLIPAENLRVNITEMIKNPQKGIIDMSGILPTPQTTFTLPTLNGVSIVTKENAQLHIGATFTYVNPLPISASIPYFGASVLLDGNNFVTFGISQINLKRNGGDMDVALAMAFDNSDATKSAVNEFFKNILNGEIKQKIEVKGIYFGGANENPNDLLTSLKLPLPTDLVDINSIKNKAIELSPIKLPLSLDQLLSSQFAPQLKSVDITTLPNRVLSLQVGAQINVPFVIVLNIGHIGISGITLDNTQFTSIGITGVQAGGAGPNFVSLGIQLSFSDEGSIPKSVKSIYDSLVGGNFISTKGGVSGVSIGVSADDSIHTFEQISLSTEIGNLITGQLNLDNMINSILTNINNNNNNNSSLITAGQGAISINIPNLAQIVIGQLGIRFLPGKMIEFKVVATINLSFSLTMNIGFASVGVFLDDLSAVDIRISTNTENKFVSIASAVKINDSDELADKLGGLAKNFFDNTPLPGNLAIKNPVIGSSNTDLIRAFSLISLELSLDKLVTPLVKNLPRSIDPIALMDQIGFKLEALGIETAAQHKMLANVKASFNNNFPVTIDIGFIELSLGLDSINFIDASLTNLLIGTGANNGLSISSSLEFQSSDQIQDKIASFASSLQQNGLGKTNELFTVSGLKIGQSPNDFIKSFEKVVVGLPSSLILNQVVVNKLLGMAGLSLNDLTIGGMLNRLDIGNIAVNMDPNGQELAVKGSLGIRNISLPISVNMGILELSIALNASPLARVILPDIKIVSSNNVISTDFTVALIFQDSDGLENEVAALAKSLIEGTNGTVIPGNANINGLLFGSSNSDKDIINTFSKVLISIPLDPILQPIKAMITNIINGFISGTGTVKLTLDDVTVGIKDSSTLTTDIAANLVGLPQISLSIPFASVDVSISNQPFVTTVLNGMKFEGNRFTTSVELKFQDNKQLSNQLAVMVSDLVFRRLTYAVSLPVGINNLIFGPSPQKTFGLTRKISIGMDVGKFVNEFSDFNIKNNLITLENIQSQLTLQGVEAKVTSPAIPNLPLNLNIPSLLAQVFFTGVSGPISKAVIKPNVRKGQAKWEFDLSITADNGPMSKALETAVPNLLAFKSYTEGVSLGAVSLCASDNCLNPPDNSFKIFNEINFIPPPLFLYNPITVELTKILPTLNLNTLFTNTGPLHIDIGNFVLSLQDSNSSVFEVSSSQPIIIQNNLENGGKNVLPVEAKLTLNPLLIPKLLLDLTNLEKNFAIVIQVSRSDVGQIGWLNDLLKNLPETVMKNLFPILQGLLKNISLGIDLNNKNNSTIPIGDGKTNGTNGTEGAIPPPIGDGTSKIPEQVPKQPADEPKQPTTNDPKQPDAKQPDANNPKQPDANDPKQPDTKDPQQGQDPKQGKTPENNNPPDNGKKDESIGGKIIDAITKPFRPKSDSLTTESIENPKPILTWTITAPSNN